MKGFMIELGENIENLKEYVVQPILVKDLPQALGLLKKLSEIEKSDTDEDVDITKNPEKLEQRLDIGLDLLTLVMKRNYPEKDKEFWKRIVDVSDIFEVINRIWAGEPDNKE